MRNGKSSNKIPRLPPDDIKWIINALRHESVKWPGRRAALDGARKRVCEGRTKKGKKIWKYHWQCAKCEQWFRDESAVEVDHVTEIGPFCGDWNRFLSRMFAGALQVLCIVCHMKKTNAYNAAHLKWKRKVPR
jgi:hypothetical protein